VRRSTKIRWSLVSRNLNPSLRLVVHRKRVHKKIDLMLQATSRRRAALKPNNRCQAAIDVKRQSMPSGNRCQATRLDYVHQSSLYEYKLGTTALKPCSVESCWTASSLPTMSVDQVMGLALTNHAQRDIQHIPTETTSCETHETTF
jgi:hypothetical protein